MSCQTHITMVCCWQNIFAVSITILLTNLINLHSTFFFIVEMNEKYHHSQPTTTCSKLAIKVLENLTENLVSQPGDVGSWRLCRHSLVFIWI